MHVVPSASRHSSQFAIGQIHFFSVWLGIQLLSQVKHTFALQVAQFTPDGQSSHVSGSGAGTSVKYLPSAHAVQSVVLVHELHPAIEQVVHVSAVGSGLSVNKKVAAHVVQSVVLVH